MLVADRMAATREIERLMRKTPKPLPADEMRAKLDRIEKRLQASGRKRARRKKNLPNFSYNKALPIIAKKDEPRPKELVTHHAVARPPFGLDRVAQPPARFERAIYR